MPLGLWGSFLSQRFLSECFSSNPVVFHCAVDASETVFFPKIFVRSSFIDSYCFSLLLGFVLTPRVCSTSALSLFLLMPLRRSSFPIFFVRISFIDSGCFSLFLWFLLVIFSLKTRPQFLPNPVRLVIRYLKTCGMEIKTCPRKDQESWSKRVSHRGWK